MKDYDLDWKPCPFCGCEDVLVEVFPVRKGFEASASCNGCPTTQTTITYDSPEEALKALHKTWNNRKQV